MFLQKFTVEVFLEIYIPSWRIKHRNREAIDAVTLNSDLPNYLGRQLLRIVGGYFRLSLKILYQRPIRATMSIQNWNKSSYVTIGNALLSFVWRVSPSEKEGKPPGSLVFPCAKYIITCQIRQLSIDKIPLDYSKRICLF